MACAVGSFRDFAILDVDVGNRDVGTFLAIADGCIDFESTLVARVRVNDVGTGAGRVQGLYSRNQPSQ
jgi:hypothetical protein